MAKVYFSTSIEKILDSINFSKLGNKVAIKVHFGEKGCNTYLNPELVKKVYDKVLSLGKQAALVECNVLYKGSRTNSTDHIRTAREHGFKQPIDILDGENGEEYIEIKGCKIGRGLENYDSLIVLTHFKGHIGTGFGGAIKNLGMGLGSRAGKLYMHSAVKPSISEKCSGCGICAEHCNAQAITIENFKAKIDQTKCEGCAICIAFCDRQAVLIPWESRSAEDLQEKIAEYAKAVLSVFPNTIFINVLENITVHCDCMGIVQEPIMPDVGIVYSEDILAIDKASLDMVNKFSKDKFNNINPVNKEKQIELGVEIGLGSAEYDLIEI